MIQPDEGAEDSTRLTPSLYGVGCIGRITQIAETGDGRYLLTLTGVARFELVEEVRALTPYRQAKVSYSRFARDFEARAGEDDVDRTGLLRALKEFALANEFKIDWKGVNEAPNEALVNALSMMAPFGPKPVPANRWVENKSALARVFILSAGVIMNILLTISVTSGLYYTYGNRYVPAVIDSVVPGASAPVTVVTELVIHSSAPLMPRKHSCVGFHATSRPRLLSKSFT
jgi:hypothetical protein